MVLTYRADVRSTKNNEVLIRITPRVLEMIESNEIMDAKTISGILAYLTS